MLNILDKIIFFLLLLSLLVIASRAECEKNIALDMETMICVDINLTLNPKWEEFY